MTNKLNRYDLGNRIRQVRSEQELTQEKLGELCGLSAAHIGHIERGTRALSSETLFKISTVLNVSVDYLFFDSVPTDENQFTYICSILKSKPKAKVKQFLLTVRALADKIDEL